MKANHTPNVFSPTAELNPREVYERNPDFTGQEEQFKLRPYEWEFYLRLDGCRTLQEICDARKLTMEWVVPMIERLQQFELIRVVEIGMEEFYHRFVDAPAVEAAPATQSSPAASETAAPGKDGKRVSFSLRNKAAAPAAAAAPVAPTVAPGPAPMRALPPLPPRVVASLAAKSTPTPVPAAEGFALKPLLDFVINHSGGGTVGQLAAYRVFLKVPNDLLRQAGIRSLNLVGEDFTIRDPALKRALLTAVEEVLGRAYVPAKTNHEAKAPAILAA